MKKIFLSLAVAVSMMASAQVFEVGQLTQLATPELSLIHISEPTRP